MAGIYSLCGAAIGDIAGSKYEWAPDKRKKPLDFDRCHFTDDTVMTVAVAQALMEAAERTDKGNVRHIDAGILHDSMIRCMRKLGNANPNAGYGRHFHEWLLSDTDEPYQSLANGSAMRVSPCGLAARTIAEAENFAVISASVTHNHPEGIRGARAVAAGVFLAKAGFPREEILRYVSRNYYPLNRTLDEIRPHYRFDVTCSGSVPEAIQCFAESTSYEDALENAISLGGDSDTQAAIAGSIAWPYYFRQDAHHFIMFKRIAAEKLPVEFLETMWRFETFCEARCGKIK